MWSVLRSLYSGDAFGKGKESLKEGFPSIEVVDTKIGHYRASI